MYKTNGIYSASLPYPKLSALEKSSEIAEKAICFRSRELKSISDCVYGSIIFENVYPWLSTLLEGIALCDMRHFKLLSALILALGGNPSINACVKTSDADISADRDSVAPRQALRILQALISDKKKLTDDYLRFAESEPRRSKSLSELIIRISADEETHIKLLENAMARITV